MAESSKVAALKLPKLVPLVLLIYRQVSSGFEEAT